MSVVLIKENLNAEAFMMDKYGTVYNVIDNKYHPNPGSEEDEYPELERCVNWLVEHNNIYPESVKSAVKDWVLCRVAMEIIEYENESIDELILNTMYSDNYTVHNTLVDYFEKVYKEVTKDGYEFEDEDYYHDLELKSAKIIADYINQYFLRIRIGGKLNPNGENAIYFRISSHGIDWHKNIVNFLWDTFKDPKKMPRRIVVCTDAETNPPEKILFDGTPEDLLDKYDDKKFEKFRRLGISITKLM